MIANRIRMRKKKGDTWDGIFADPEVGRVLKSKGLIANANKSSIEELATITRLNTSNYVYDSYFHKNTRITKFPELKYCTGLTSLRGVFYMCSNLTEVAIPEGVTSMHETFWRCSSLTSVGIIPEGVTTMYYTFSECFSLTSAPNIPEGVRDMTATFMKCSSLINIPIIPSSVTNMNSTFNGCASLDDILILKPLSPPKIYYTFTGGRSAKEIYVPDESVNTYKSAEGWRDLSSKIYPISQLPE